ncbi:MAG: DUF2190 domain-containing protein [Proteobacteria bacterium]|nr:DUF2190 domain-containing protein [Pseudomonadota bacterium]
MGRQYQKTNAVTIVASAAVVGYRFIAHDGGYATSAGGNKDTLGVSESAADVGAAFSAVTGFSFLVEAGEALAEHAFVKPAADGSGKAITGSATDHCGRVMPGSSSSAAGQLVEIRILPHRHT